MDTTDGMAREAGRIIRALRGSSISQAALALRAQTSQSYVSRLEAGGVNPTIEQLEHLLNCLGYRLKIEAEPLSRRGDPIAYAQQLAMTAEERIASAAAIHNTILELRES
jgi:transcriptional regulator with XRE-family HTH domain